MKLKSRKKPIMYARSNNPELMMYANQHIVTAYVTPFDHMHREIGLITRLHVHAYDPYYTMELFG